MRPKMPPDYVAGNPITLAKDQPEYRQLPAKRTEDGQITTCWELTAVERAAVLAGMPIYLRLHTFNRPMQPLLIWVEGVEEETLDEGADD